jgi:hypothetical protein
MDIEKKLDRIYQLIDILYKSMPPVLTAGPKSGIIIITDWD